MSDDRPAYIRPVGGTLEDTAFETASQRAAAEAILEHWPETHNFREIARRTSWSPAHIRKTFHEYFEPAEEPHHSDREADTSDTVPPVSEQHRRELRDAYIRGYLDGVRDERRGEAVEPEDRQ